MISERARLGKRLIELEKDIELRERRWHGREVAHATDVAVLIQFHLYTCFLYNRLLACSNTWHVIYIPPFLWVWSGLLVS